MEVKQEPEDDFYQPFDPSQVMGVAEAVAKTGTIFEGIRSQMTNEDHTASASIHLPDGWTHNTLGIIAADKIFASAEEYLRKARKLLDTEMANENSSIQSQPLS